MMELKGASASVFDLKRYVIQDGPGIRTTVFFKGCPLHCLWCANPESISRKPELSYNREYCLFCRECEKQCKQKALVVNESSIVHRKDLCINCQQCAKECYSNALKFIGEQYTVSQLVSFLEKDSAFYKRSNGGVTLSGGEPLFQADFVIDLIKELRNRGIHTAIQTTGYGDAEAVKEISKIVDLFIFDIKHSDPYIHKKLTGKDNHLIMNNLDLISKSGVPIYISIPLIPGMNDDVKNIYDTVSIINNIPNIQIIRIIPYHKMGIAKYVHLAKPYRLESIQQFEEKELDSKIMLFTEKLTETQRNKLIVI